MMPDLLITFTLNDDENQDDSDMILKLRELSLVLPSIMSRLEQFDQAILFIKLARDLFNFEKCT